MRKIDDAKMLKMHEQGIPQKDIAKHFGVSPAAVCKRLKRYQPLPQSLECLTDKEQKFAVAIAEGKTKTQAALASYECGNMESAKSMGKQLMAKPDIQTAVAEIMQNEGLTRTYRVRKLKQHVDNRDPNVSLKALDQTHKLDGAYREEVNINVNVRQQFNENQMELKRLYEKEAQSHMEMYERTKDPKYLRLAEACQTLAEDGIMHVIEDHEIIEDAEVTEIE